MDWNRSVNRDIGLKNPVKKHSHCTNRSSDSGGSGPARWCRRADTNRRCGLPGTRRRIYLRSFSGPFIRKLASRFSHPGLTVHFRALLSVQLHDQANTVAACLAHWLLWPGLQAFWIASTSGKRCTSAMKIASNGEVLSLLGRPLLYLLYILVVIEVGPVELTIQQLREAIPSDHSSSAPDSPLGDALQPRATLRRECLDLVIPLERAHGW